MFDVVILTDNRYVNPEKKDWYINQVLLEDKLLKTALEKQVLLLQFMLEQILFMTIITSLH